MTEEGKCVSQRYTGSAWPGELCISDTRILETAQSSRLTVGLLLGILFSLLLVTFTLYSMATANERILEGVFEVVRTGITAGVGWALGRQT